MTIKEGKYSSILSIQYQNTTYKLISRIAVLGIPSSSASNLIFFNAITSLVTRSLALYTTP